MLWFNPNFDQNDQLARVYMKYQGQYYDKGTKVKTKGPRGPVKATFVGWRYQRRGCFEAESGSYFDLYDTYSFTAADYCKRKRTKMIPRNSANLRSFIFSFCFSVLKSL